LFIVFTVVLSRGQHPKLYSKKRQPNIILFFADDLGWSVLGYRNPVFETENIKKLVKSSLSFEQSYIASPTCSPNRSTLLIGQHPARLQMVRHIPDGKKYGFILEGQTNEEFHYLERDPAQFPSRNWLPLEHTTYTEALSTLGYFNMFIGKWHLGHEKFHPIHQGFDKQIGTSNAGHPKSYYPPYFGMKADYTDPESMYLTDKLTHEAVSFVNHYNKDQPFMLNFSYYSVHTPHQGRKDLIEHFKSKGLDEEFANYAAMVKARHQSIGQVLEAINNKGIENETIIKFLFNSTYYNDRSI
jgi:arylsulfatase A-like enzyme